MFKSKESATMHQFYGLVEQEGGNEKEREREREKERGREGNEHHNIKEGISKKDMEGRE